MKADEPLEDLYNPPWRQLLGAMFTRPSDPRVFGSLDLDFRVARRFIAEAGDRKLTPNHLLIAALGRTLAEDVPELNCLLVRGRAVPRQGVHVSITVSIPDQRGIAMSLIRDADRKTLTEIAEEMRARAAEERSRAGSRNTGNRNALGSIPWPFRRLLVRFMLFLVTELGIDLPPLGVTRDSFGSITLTNIGSFGLDNGMLALMPVSRVPAAIAMGRVVEKPWVEDGRVEPRWVLPLTGSFDHRLVEARLIARLADGVQRRLRDPACLEKPAERAPSPA